MNGSAGVENVDDEEAGGDVKVPKEEDAEDGFWRNGIGSASAKGFGVHAGVVDDEEGDCTHESPGKRAKGEGVGMQGGYGSDGQGRGESSVSEFADVV